MLPDPVELTGLPLWGLVILAFVVAFLLTYFWPKEDRTIVIFESREELQTMCWEGLRNQRRFE